MDGRLPLLATTRTAVGSVCWLLNRAVAASPTGEWAGRNVLASRTASRNASRARFTGRYSHVLKVFLVDREGDIRNIYSAGFLVPELVVNDIKTVLAGPVRP